jgi:putative transposase
MSWNQTDPMHERHKLIAEYQSGLYSIAELADRYAVARKTVYKWIDRYRREGSAGLQEHSRAPKTCPHRTDPALAERIVQLRREHPSWGARKLRVVLERSVEQGDPLLKLPSASTIATILAHRQLVVRRPQRRRPQPVTRAGRLVAEAANAVWCIDFKGEFRLGNGQYCYPLTLTDAYSRYVLACDGLPNTGYDGTQRSMQRLFQEYGLPDAIRSDNGVPFASQALGGLSRLNVWWMKLGISHQRIPPGQPQHNGRHERMHRTLKAETTRPPAETMRAQQQRFQQWREQFNEDRPHEAIGYATPATLYQSSQRLYPQRLPKPEYAGHCQVRLVSAVGAIRFKKIPIFISSVLAGEYVALEEIDDGIWNVLFFDRQLARYDQRSGRML